MTSQRALDVRPSDLDQSLVRVIFVSAVVLWSYFNAPAASLSDALHYKYFALAFAYWTFSLLAYGWTFWLLRRGQELSPMLIATRVVGIFADIGALSAYTAISGSFGVILFPIYMNSIIGYGYRFGVRYLYFTLAVAAAFFTIALQFNDYIRASRELTLAYYLGMVLVPLYAAALLKKHREVLERIRDLNDARSRFIANMSHELRTPLHAIISVSDVLRESYGGDQASNESAHQKMQMITDSAQHLLGLVNKILDVASADAGKVPSRQRGRVDLLSVTQSALRICQPKAQQQGIGFHWFFDSRLPSVVMGSADYLQEILINTVGNAVKYTPSGYVHVCCLQGERDGTPQLDISIIDTGIGISAKLLPNIFEPFTLGDDSTARKYAGTGLGLTLTKQYVEMLGGSIKVESSENIGTNCRVILPLEQVGRAELADETPVVLRRCVLVSSHAPTQEELADFAAASWNCEWLAPSLLEGLETDDAQVIFIAKELLSFQDVLFDKLTSNQRTRLLVCYGDIAYGEARHLLLNSSVRVGVAEDLQQVRLLADAFFAFASDVPAQPRHVAQPVDVLVADDNATNLATARMALESVGHRVTCVDNGESALAALDDLSFGVAFIDMHMPGMSGIEVTQIYQFMSKSAGTPIVILTADATPEAREAAEACGAVAYLTKPLGARELRDAVARYARDPQPMLPAPPPLREAHEHAPTLDTGEIDELIEIGIGPADLIEMVADFETDSRALIETAIASWRSEDVLAVREAMHALKGAAATLGARKLSLLAADFERTSGTSDARHGGEMEVMFHALLDESVSLVRQRIRQRAPASATTR